MDNHSQSYYISSIDQKDLGLFIKKKKKEYSLKKTYRIRQILNITSNNITSFKSEIKILKKNISMDLNKAQDDFFYIFKDKKVFENILNINEDFYLLKDITQFLLFIWVVDFPPHKKYIKFEGIDLFEKNSSNYIFLKLNFKNLNLCGSVLSHCIFYECFFENSDMENADLSNSYFYKCKFAANYIRFTNFDKSEFVRSSFKNNKTFFNYSD